MNAGISCLRLQCRILNALSFVMLSTLAVGGVVVTGAAQTATQTEVGMAGL